MLYSRAFNMEWSFPTFGGERDVRNSIAAGVVAISLAYVGMSLLSYRPGGKLDGPAGYPVFGNAFDIPPDKIFNTLMKWKAKYGNIYQFFAVGNRFVVITDPVLAKEILLKRPKTFLRARSLEKTKLLLHYEGSVFHEEGAVWNRARKITAPPFSRQNVANKLPRILDASKLFIGQLDQLADGKTAVDIKHETFMYTLRVLVCAAMGLNLPKKHQDYAFSSDFATDLQNTFEFTIQRALFPFPEWIWRLTPLYKLQTTALEANVRFEECGTEIIAQARQNAARGLVQGQTSSMIDEMLRKTDAAVASGAAAGGGDATSEGPTGDLVDASDVELLSNVKTFFGAGSETTSITITWMCFYVSRHADVRAALQREAAQFFNSISCCSSGGGGDGDAGEVSVEAIANAISAENAPMANAVFKEILRIASPASFLIHETVTGIKSVTLSNGVVITDKDKALVYIDGLLLDEDTYGADAAQFNPSRWLTADAAQLLRMEESFLPFGFGARVCPGRNLALHEAVVALLCLVHHFDFRLACPEQEIRRVLQFTSTPNKMPMYVTRRDVSKSFLSAH